MTELYDLRLGSGVVLLDEGVTLLRGIIEGDCAADLEPAKGGSGRDIGGGVKGMGGALGIMDILFILRASVGLTVLAPRPVAWLPGIIDNRLAEDGVLVPPVPLFGDRAGQGFSGVFGDR
jgi:hypothetical protein